MSNSVHVFGERDIIGVFDSAEKWPLMIQDVSEELTTLYNEIQWKPLHHFRKRTATRTRIQKHMLERRRKRRRLEIDKLLFSRVLQKVSADLNDTNIRNEKDDKNEKNDTNDVLILTQSEGKNSDVKKDGKLGMARVGQCEKVRDVK